MVGEKGRRYELEKVRYYRYDEKVTSLATSDSLNELIKKAEKIKLRMTDNFEDKVRVLEMRNNEVYCYPYIRTVDE